MEAVQMEVSIGVWDPLLVPAALEAVKKWRYRPFLLNGEPVEVETTITVNFDLSY
jgi:protein TonB